MRQGFYAKHIKRKLDIVLSAGALFFLSPVILATAVAVRKNLGSPVLFTQLRPGKGERIFKMYKFRTMTDERDAEGKPSPCRLKIKVSREVAHAVNPALGKAGL